MCTNPNVLLVENVFVQGNFEVLALNDPRMCHERHNAMHHTASFIQSHKYLIMKYKYRGNCGYSRKSALM